MDGEMKLMLDGHDPENLKLFFKWLEEKYGIKPEYVDE